MKQWLSRLLLIAALLALGFWAWRTFFPGPERVIQRRMGELARLASVSSQESEVARLFNSTKLAGYFSQDVQFNIDIPGVMRGELRGRDELLRVASAARGLGSGMRVQFPDIVVHLDSGDESALVNVTVEARIPGERDTVLQEMKLTFSKIDGDWLISRVETVKTLL